MVFSLIILFLAFIYIFGFLYPLDVSKGYRRKMKASCKKD